MVQDKVYKTIEEVLLKAKTAEGKTFGFYDINNRLNDLNNKGGLGQVIEEGLFGYNVNSKPEADFANLGLELKVTGVKLLGNNNKSNYVAKERLVLNVINYTEEANATFETSSFWSKNNKLLLLFYVYDFTKEKKDFVILEPLLYEFSDEDLKIIRKDWDFIHEKIKEGKADELTESDTFYLAACTKGSKAADSYRHQYGSDLNAKQRAYSLKKSFIDKIIRERMLNYEFESIVKRLNINLEKQSITDYVIDYLKKYQNLNATILFKKYNINPLSKSRYASLITKLLGMENSIDLSDELGKAGIIMKNVIINENGNLVESISFPVFKFTDIYSTNFEDSDFYETFFSHSFLFNVFKKGTDGITYFKSFVWRASNRIIDINARKVYNKTRDIISSGNIVSEIKKSNDGKITFLNNFPKMKDDPYFHVRPHGQTRDDVYVLPVKDKVSGLKVFTKQCFWINAKYIEEVIKGNDYGR